MKILMKFGGTSLADGRKIKHAASLIKEYAVGNQIVVVPSAMNGMTDSLIQLVDKAAGGRWQEVSEALSGIRERHLKAVDESLDDVKLKEQTRVEVEDLVKSLEQVLTGIYILREFTPRSRDLVLSYGERLSTPIVSASIRDLELKAKSFTGGEAGIITDENFGEATPLMNVTRLQVQKTLGPFVEKDIIPVVTGFIAATQSGDVTTIGRGGSDYTATILGASLDVDEVWIWSDVDGIMSADPKIVKNARLLEQISYSEAGEMAVFGAKAMHPRAIDPAGEYNIPVRIRNTFNPECKGTLVTKEPKIVSRDVVKSVALIKDAGMINVSGSSMVGKPGTAAKVFDVLGRNGINILMISQSVTEASITLLVRRSMLQKASTALEIALLSKGVIGEVSSDEDVGVIAVLGAGMKGTPGVAAKTFQAVAEKGINVKMIAQGSSELNISFVVSEADCEEAVRAIHEKFNLGIK